MSYNENALTLDSNMFNALKSDFNQLLRATLSSMLQKEGEKAKMSMTLNITLTEGYAPDPQEVRYEAERKIIIPRFEHKIVATMQYKDEKSGFLGGTDYELFWDKESSNYIMRRLKRAQTSFFDSDDADELTADNLNIPEDVNEPEPLDIEEEPVEADESNSEGGTTDVEA